LLLNSSLSGTECARESSNEQLEKQPDGKRDMNG
jgi:hypothetical protein